MLEPHPDDEHHNYAIRLPESRHEEGMWLQWVVRLRWFAIVAQVITLSFSFSVIDQPAVTVPVLGGLVFVLVLANLYAMRQLDREERIYEGNLLTHLMLDVSVLTGFFMMCGGPENPFVGLYLIHIALGAVMMRGAAAAGLAAYVCGGYALMYAFNQPLHFDKHWIPEETLVVAGDHLAFVITVFSVWVMVVGTRNSLRIRRGDLGQTPEQGQPALNPGP